jgi:hypothetical protein
MNNRYNQYRCITKNIDSMNRFIESYNTKVYINKINMQLNQVHAMSTHDDLIE